MKAALRIALMTIAVAGLVGGTLLAQGRGPRAGMLGSRGMGGCILANANADSIAGMLQLTDEQTERVAALVADFNEQNAEVLERARQFTEERDSVWSSAERPKRHVMVELAEKYDYPMRELAPKCQEFRDAVGSVLTAEQRAKLDPPRRGRVGPRPRAWRGP